jgi:Initiator Replication protein
MSKNGIFQADKYGRLRKADSVIMHRAQGELKAIDGKLFNFLLSRAANRVHHRDAIHQIPLANAIKFLNGATPQAVNESLRRLGEVDIEIDYKDAATGEKHVMLVHFLSFDSTTCRDGILEWAFDPMLNDLLHEPRIYASLNLKTLRMFKRLAAQRLYEKMMLQNGLRLNRTWRVGVPEFYNFCGQFNESARFTNFRTRVLTPAVLEVNEHAPFSVEVRYIRDTGRGRKVYWIEFTPVPKSVQDPMAARKAGVRRVARDKRFIDLFDNRTNEERGSNLVVSEQAYRAAEGMIEGRGLKLAKIDSDFKDFAQSRVIKDADQLFLNFVAAQLERVKDPEFAFPSDDIIAKFLK